MFAVAIASAGGGAKAVEPPLRQRSLRNLQHETVTINDACLFHRQFIVKVSRRTLNIISDDSLFFNITAFAVRGYSVRRVFVTINRLRSLLGKFGFI